MKLMARMLILLAVVLAGPLGCAGTTRRDAVPEAVADHALPYGQKGWRTWGDKLAREEVDEYIHATEPVLRRRFGADIAAGRTPVAHYLALSGGGQYGAFAAGILEAWTAGGDRPEFQGVSGVSTGAIIAPFAFLGPEYDKVLTEIYTQYGTDDLIESTLLSGLLSGMALSSTDRLARVIERYVTPELMAKIAAESERGRKLYIGTTNLDAGRPMLWDITAIAASGHPEALGLVRKLIRGSAAIPVAFPPILVEVDTPDGRKFDEMHVDGGASSQVTFVAPDVPIADITRAVLGRNIDRRLWVIINNDLDPPHQHVRPRLTAIGAAALHSLLRGSGVGDVFRLYTIAERDDVKFNLAYIPATIPCTEPTEDFDKAFMKCLFDYSGEMYRSGNLWQAVPPGYIPSTFTPLQPRQGRGRRTGP